MITNTKQNWMIGQNVKVGFLQLRVLGVRAEFDGLPDIYTLSSMDGRRFYEFIPHNGLSGVSREEAMRNLADEQAKEIEAPEMLLV